MTEKKDEAIRAAFRKGQDAWRNNKSINDNPYPVQATDYHDAWNQGWEAEDEIQRK